MAAARESLGEAIRGSKAVESRNRKLYEFYGAPKPDGVTEKSLTISMPRNAVVHTYEVILTAATAHAVTAGDAGQVRTTDLPGGVSVVLDFGTLRTVSALQAPDGVLIRSISTWIGTEFASPPKFTSDSGVNYVSLPSEVRTERLQVVVTGSTTTEELATDLVLVLPESPAGLELRIDGAAPVFAQPSAVEPTNASTLSTQNWNADSQRIVDLGPALAALTGNPLDSTSASFTATLTSRVPGTLDLQPRPAGQAVLRIRRATFDGQTSRDVAFDAEGQQTLVLDSLPPDLTVQEVHLTLAGTPPPLRVSPPLGPNPPDPAFADFTFTPQRAASVLLPLETRFAELAGVRVPLAGQASGAEARVVLWRSKDQTDLSPTEPLPNGASDPLALESTDERWCTFMWKKPIAIPQDCVLWAAVAVSRGGASTTFAENGAGPGAERFLWGAPSGPWHDLPDALSAVRGRIRTIGKPKPDAVYPPLRVQLIAGSAALDLTPNPRGTPAVLTIAPTLQPGACRLVLVSHAAATLTLRDIDVISTT